MRYQVKFSPKTKRHMEKAIREGLWDKIIELAIEISENPYKPPCEKLSKDLAGYFNKDINHKHRFVYSVDDAKRTITVIRCFGHYDDASK